MPDPLTPERREALRAESERARTSAREPRPYVSGRELASLFAALDAAEAERDAAREEVEQLRGAGKVGSYCTARIEVAHEKFGCMKWEGHHGYHEGYVECGQCPECDGWEAHADGCSRIGEELGDDERDDFDVRWNDGDNKPEFVNRAASPRLSPGEGSRDDATPA